MTNEVLKKIVRLLKFFNFQRIFFLYIGASYKVLEENLVKNSKIVSEICPLQHFSIFSKTLTHDTVIVIEGRTRTPTHPRDQPHRQPKTKKKSSIKTVDSAFNIRILITALNLMTRINKFTPVLKVIQE